MLVSYKGAQPQKLPQEHVDKTETELNELGFTICPEPPSVQPGYKTVWVNNSWEVQEPTPGELQIQWQQVKNEVERRIKESDEDILLLQEKNLTIPSSVLSYRNAVRAVLKSQDPFSVVWPDRPVVEITMIDEVRAAAARRILEICPEWKQRNLTAQAAILAKKGESNWTPEEAAAWAAGEFIWGQIANIRAKSDILEAMDEIPADFTDDSYWV